MAFKRHLAWMAASQLCFFVLQFGGSVFIARLLSPYDMGIYAVALAMVGILSIIQAFGLSAYIVREPELTPNAVTSVFTLNLLIALGLSAAIYALSIFGGLLLHEAGVRRVLKILALLPLLGALEFLPAAQLERAANFRTIALINTGRTLLTQSVAVIAALKGQSYMSLAYGQLAASLFSVCAYNIAGRRHAQWRFGLADWRTVLGFGLQMLAISGVNTIAARVAEMILGRLVGLAALGLYSRASNLNNLVWENIHLVIGRVLFVDLSARVRSGQSLRTTYLTTVEILTALLWPAFAGLAIVSGPFILIVYGKRWVSAAHPLTMLSLSAILLVAISMTWELFVIRGRTTTQTRIEVVRTGFGLASFSIGCLFGLTGAAAGRVVEAAISIFLYRPHLDSMTDTRTRDFLPIYARSAGLTAIAVAPAGLVMAYHRASEFTPLPELGGAVLLGVVLWLTALLGSGHPLGREGVAIFARMRGGLRLNNA